MTAQPDVIVIGGGIIGLSIALRLAQAGRGVCLLERGAFGKESSWAGAGMIDAGSPCRTDALAALRRRSVEQYRAFADEVRALSGMDPEYRVCGSLDLLFDANQLSAAQRQLDASQISDSSPEAKLDIVTGERLRGLQPGLAAEFERALFDPQAARVRSPRMVRALAGACSAVGVDMRAETPVMRLVIQSGRIVGVETEGGKVFADHVVLAAGAWSSQLHPLLAQIAPVRPVRGQIVAMQTAPGTLRLVVHHGKHYLVPRDDGLVLAGATQEEVGYDNVPTADALEKLRGIAIRVLPSLIDAPVVAHWSGLRPATPSGRPYIGRVTALPGLILATGHFRSGLTLAPETAQVVTNLVTGRTATTEFG